MFWLQERFNLRLYFLAWTASRCGSRIYQIARIMTPSTTNICHAETHPGRYPNRSSVVSQGKRGPLVDISIKDSKIPQPCSTSRYMVRDQDQYMAIKNRNGTAGTIWRMPLLNCRRLNWLAAVKSNKHNVNRRIIKVSRLPSSLGDLLISESLRNQAGK